MTTPSMEARKAPPRIRRATALALVWLAFACENPDFSRPADASLATDATSAARDADEVPTDAAPARDARPDSPDADPASPDADPDVPPPADAGDAPPPDAGPPPVSPLVGLWKSEGGDIAELLASPPVNLVRVDANFRADGTFLVTAVDQDQRATELSGRYTVEPGRGPLPDGIVLSQEEPAVVRSEGIFEIEGDTLTYEVAQVEPPLNGVSAPTPEAGFGSTSGGSFDRQNVQTYRRVRR